MNENTLLETIPESSTDRYILSIPLALTASVSTEVKSAINKARTLKISTPPKHRNNFDTIHFAEKLQLIQENDKEIANMLGEALNIDLDKLFHSPGAITILHGGRLIDSVKQTQNGDGEESAVCKDFEINGGGSFEEYAWRKAAIASNFALMDGNNVISTGIMQAMIEIIAKEDDSFEGNPAYFRGLYHNEGISGGVSGSFLHHESMKKIIGSFYLNTIYFNIHGIADPYILAGMGDELIIRFLLHDEEEWPEQIKLFANDLKEHANKDDLLKLC